MKKLLAILVLGLLLVSCSQSDARYIENCANSLTKDKWKEREEFSKKEVKRFKKDIADLKTRDWRTEAERKKRIKLWTEIMKGYEKQAKIYKNIKNKDLKYKLNNHSYFFSQNFKKCENEFQKNPITFRNTWK